VKRTNRIFIILCSLFLCLVFHLAAGASDGNTLPVKTGEYRCADYAGSGHRCLALFREADGTTYFSLAAGNDNPDMGKGSYNNVKGYSCELGGVFLQNGNQAVLEAGHVIYGNSAETGLQHKAPVKVKLRAKLSADGIYIYLEDSEKTAFTDKILLEGAYTFQGSGQRPVIGPALALYRVENLPGNAKKAGFDPKKVTEWKTALFDDSVYGEKSWSVDVVTENRQGFHYLVALNGREIFKLTGMGLWQIVRDGVAAEGRIPD